VEERPFSQSIIGLFTVVKNISAGLTHTTLSAGWGILNSQPIVEMFSNHFISVPEIVSEESL
jgi:hypothetical protein